MIRFGMEEFRMENYDNLKLISGNSHPELATKIANNLGIQIIDADIQYFKNKEIRPIIRESVRGQNVIIIQTGSSDDDHSINDYIMETYLLICTCRRSDANSITLIMPNYPYARQDKKDNPRGSISSRDVADLFESAGIDRIVCLDLHSAQIQGFFKKPCDNLYAIYTLKRFLNELLFENNNNYREQFVIVSPDEGALKRAKEYAQIFNLPLMVMSKERDYSKKNVVENVILLGSKEILKGRTVIIIDDMCDTGGTIQTVVNELIIKGAKDAIIAVTHGILSDPAIERINNNPNIKMFITSNSLPQTKNVELCRKIKVFDISPLLTEVVRVLADGRSISDIFKK